MEKSRLCKIFNKLRKAVFIIACISYLIFSGENSLAQDKMVDVGGYKIQYEEYGNGDPTVVFLNGGTARMSYWKEIVEPISKISRVILYERAGHEKSEMGRIPRHGINVAEELNTLLIQLDVQSPYILVAHSAGCMYARIYASRYSKDVAGLILLDPGDVDFLDKFGEKYLKGEEKERWEAFWSNTWGRLESRQDGFGGEVREKSKTIKQMTESSMSSKMFYYVLSGLDESNPDYFIEDYSKKTIKNFFKYQFEYHSSLVEDYPRGKVIKVEDSQHVIHQDRPDLVISVIKTLIDSVKMIDR
ncbi:MAG: alpha/beta hydrolase [bacterium]|nr:alpha/beta hydrolase [bacterium]